MVAARGARLRLRGGASDTAPVREFITHGSNGLLTPFLEPDRLADTILELLEDRALAVGLSTEARAYAERTLRWTRILPATRR